MTLTQKQVVRRIAQLCREDNQSRVAEQMDVSPQYLSDILHGRREPGVSVLKALGLRKLVIYEEVGK